MVNVKRKKGEFISSFSYYNLHSTIIFSIIIFTFGCLLNVCICNEVTTVISNKGEYQPLEIISTDHIAEACISKCPEENRTNSEHLNIVGCGRDCYMRQCNLGCTLWELALNASCSAVCNKTDEILEPKEFDCVMGCNNAVTIYFEWLREQVGTPSAPALVADTLTATSLSLEWEIPNKLIELTKNKPYSPKSYLVQWRYEVGDWKFCRNQSMEDNSTVRVENLQPYTKYRFRVVLPLLSNYKQVLVSEQSVVISTLAKGVPLSQPVNVRAVAVDHSRISVSWEPGPFPNGPILSYVLQIRDVPSEGYFAIKDISASENSKHYMFHDVPPATNFTIQVSITNAEGEGPPTNVSATTPPEPLIKNDEPEPRLIVAAEFLISSQGSDILSGRTNEFYKSDHRILGIAIHIAKKLIFVSDQAGYIFKAPLERTGKRQPIITPHSGYNFLPMALSMDWLNDHLYILGEVINSNPRRWQISRCDLNGHGLTIAIAGLQKEPSHVHVDPYNGFLFWIVGGRTSNSGLFRLDLADISNGVKHEDKPLHIIQNENLGAFTVDYRKFRLLIPQQDQNTVISVTFDGKDREDIRKNTQSPKLRIVKSLTMANGIFYWTNGHDLFMEDHHKEVNNYFHNAYTGLSNETFVAVCVNVPSAQPTPVPVNPPSGVQALLSSRKAKISWIIPHLLGDQGKGAWQEWSYELEIINGSDRNVIRNIKGAQFTVDKLESNTNYTFRAAAYTIAGKGPWSTEFHGKTLSSSHDRYLIWSSSDGLLQSDIIGEHIHTLIPKSILGDHHISDMAWFDDVLFFISNSTLKFYNRTNGLLSKFGELDSVESIAVDWIGRKIYWSTQHYIKRASLSNNQDQDRLPIYVFAREIKIDSLRGHIYFSTGHSVEVCRLNGKNRMEYFRMDMYSAKQVMGLTLDMDNERIYWIVRSLDGSSLYSAPMAKYWTKDSTPVETILEERSLNGSLIHFSDRLLWLQDNNTVAVGDMSGKNLAHISNSKLNGLTSVSIIDPTHHVYPNLTSILNVIPEQIDNRTIRIFGTWKSLNITWEPVHSVTYGDIFYEITIKSDINDIHITNEITNSYFNYTSNKLQPYMPIEIKIRAFTYWGQSKLAKAQLYSPAAEPSEPTKPRVFIKHYHEPFMHDLNITATFRWEPPIKPNGPILYYKIFCWFKQNGNEKRIYDEFVSGHIEQVIIPNLILNLTYYFQVQAYTSVAGGSKTHLIQINSNHENPVPIIIVATHDHILEFDLDLNINKTLAHTGNLINHLAYIEHENMILWINENRELISYNGTKVKLFTISNEVLSFTVDWIQRIVYWSQINEPIEGSSIYQWDLNRQHQQSIYGKEILQRSNYIRDLSVSPMNQMLYWLEFDTKLSNFGKLIQYNFNLSEEFEFDTEIECLNGSFKKIVFDTTSLNENRLILIDNYNKIFQYGLRSDNCLQLKIKYDDSTNEIVKDSSKMYLMKNQTILTYNHKQNLQYEIHVNEATNILAYYHQSYPPKRCLLPKQKILKMNYSPRFVNHTENSLYLELPEPEIIHNCSLKLPGIKYKIIYAEIDVPINSSHPNPYSKTRIAYERLTKIENLKAFTKYQFQIGINNYYGEKIHLKMIYGPIVIFSTAPGAPSLPRNITAESISPNEAIVQWLSPLTLNSDNVWYQVHWQTENPSRVVNRQERRIKDDENLLKNSNDSIAIKLSKLLPSQTYTIWIQAYSSIKTYSVSSEVKIETFSEPENITIVETTPYTFKFHWKNHQNITRYIFEYTSSGSNEYKIVSDSDNDERLDDDKEYFLVNDLQPKTHYIFTIKLFYTKRQVPYIWPSDNRFTFETLGDHPTSPGKPIVNHVSGDVYKVSWEPSKENGATIEEYSLEALQSRISNRIIRSTKDYEVSAIPDYESYSGPNYTTPQRQTPWAEELDPIEDKWNVYYNGTDSYWIIKDLHPINKFSFRVRARNSYGWGPYSSTSEPISEPYILPERRDSLLIAIFVPVLVVIICVIFGVCMILIVQRRSSHKTVLDDDNPRLTDVELANLPRLPRGGTHTANILYSPGPLTDADVALLPQIRRDQITMSSFLGSGAFGEVYEGCVRNVGTTPETRVAIKTLRKGATEQEKLEFLQEAQLMSNFKHEHILRLIGVCFDSDTLYIIMELMQGGDLLSYLRQSRPTVGIPSSLTLLDLISMCVDVSSGCRYLEEMHFVHRDLACRNCLVSSVDPDFRVVKIGDFGLARDIYKNDYYRKEGEGLLPVRWMSPESLVDGVFTSQSDIWAFGVLCWEIMTLGQQPYPARNNVEVLHYVRDGGRLGRPADCPDELYQLMLKCWSYCPEDRPTFRYCLEVLQCLKDSTSECIQITASNSNRIANGTLKFGSDGIRRIENIEPPIIITPTSSTTSTIPKYLELLYDENDEQQQQNQLQQSTNLISDGYEIPLANIHSHDFITTCSNEGIFDKDRTFSSSSTLSRSNSPNLLVNNLGQYNKMNAILTVTLPPNSQENCCSTDRLLLVSNNNNNNINNNNKNSTIGPKPVYSNTQNDQTKSDDPDINNVN